VEKIVECVPNFSEGRDMGIIEKITAEIDKINGAMLLDVDPGKDTNRTVVTFAGTPESVAEAAFQAIKMAAQLIDMSKHKGAHARMGATDVCPFVPVSGVTMDDCVEIAKQVGRRVAEELHIPVYLYAEAAARPERYRLPDIRQGEYEALPEKLQQKEFKPDFGEATFNARSGATAIGARDFLIAYNIDLNTRNVKLANKVAKRVREKGRMVKNKETGVREQVPGSLKKVQGMGWYIDEYHMAQLSYNIMDYKTTPLYRVFEESEKYAAQFGARVTGSEMVGLVPLQAMLAVGRHYLLKQKGTTGVSEKELVRVAIQSLGLNEISEFDPQERIIEYKLRKNGILASMNIYEFADELASDSPAPGGGSVAALCGALSAGLSSMVGNLTYNKRAYKEVREEMIETSEKAQQLKDFFVSAIDKDTDAFNQIMDAFSLPKKTDEEQKVRNQAIQAATREATLVPFSVLEKCQELVELALTVTKKGNKNSLSDSGVAGLSASVAAEGALYNVMINLEGIEDEAFKKDLARRAKKINLQVQSRAGEIRKFLFAGLNIDN
jgi:glutamate formiminotransferase/formiminotetrahydrofolate cyclodeaminase